MTVSAGGAFHTGYHYGMWNHLSVLIAYEAALIMTIFMKLGGRRSATGTGFYLTKNLTGQHMVDINLRIIFYFMKTLANMEK